MAIDSYGYPLGIMTGADWARAQWGLGRRYWVYDAASVRVTPVTGGTRQVSVAVGYFGGWGIRDYNDAAATVTLPTVASGTRYFMIVARRSWTGTGGATTFTYVDAGTTGASTLPTRNTNPGTLDDQPLAMVPLTAGQTVPGTPIDLRLVGTEVGGQHAMSQLVLQYANHVGISVRIGEAVWTRRLRADGLGSAWNVDEGRQALVPITPASRGAVISYPSGWGHGSTGITPGTYGLRDGNVCHVFIQSRAYSTFPFDRYGGMGDLVIGNVSSQWRPPHYVPARGTFWGGLLGDADSYYTNGCDFTLTPGGDVQIRGGAPPDHQITRRVTDSPSIEVLFTFIRPS